MSSYASVGSWNQWLRILQIIRHTMVRQEMMQTMRRDTQSNKHLVKTNAEKVY